MGYKNILYTESDSIARIVYNRPEKHNALSNDMISEIHQALDEAENNDSIKVLVISGAGPSFCSGHDLSQVGVQYGWEEPKPGKKVRKPSQRARLRFDRESINEKLRRILLFPKVTIAQVHGYCIAEGFYTVSLCDMAIAAKDTMFARSEQLLGVAGMGPDFQILVMNIGLKKTLEVLFSGRYLSGEEAEGMGLVNKAVPIERLEQEVEELAQRVCVHSADGIAIGKAGIHMNYEDLGLIHGFTNNHVIHTLGTNIRLEPDEYNLFRDRRDKGLAEAINIRNKRLHM